MSGGNCVLCRFDANFGVLAGTGFSLSTAKWLTVGHPDGESNGSMVKNSVDSTPVLVVVAANVKELWARFGVSNTRLLMAASSIFEAGALMAEDVLLLLKCGLGEFRVLRKYVGMGELGTSK
jgi:hypothetical protein